jgi:hypothetical protein
MTYIHSSLVNNSLTRYSFKSLRLPDFCSPTLARNPEKITNESFRPQAFQK